MTDKQEQKPEGLNRNLKITGADPATYAVLKQYSADAGLPIGNAIFSLAVHGYNHRGCSGPADSKTSVEAPMQSEQPTAPALSDLETLKRGMEIFVEFHDFIDGVEEEAFVITRKAYEERAAVRAARIAALDEDQFEDPRSGFSESDAEVQDPEIEDPHPGEGDQSSSDAQTIYFESPYDVRESPN